MNHIPSVDLRDFLSDDKNKKSLFVQSIGKAFQDIGFCAVRGPVSYTHLTLPTSFLV